MHSLYTHIPFCASKCGYCDFYSVANAGRVADFVERVKGEIASRAVGGGVDTIYFGGGTPSVLSAAQLGDILKSQMANFDCLNVSEITLEANPEQMTPDFLEQVRQHGFNRISVGIQSFNDAHLKIMNRRHSVSQAIKAIQAARQAGFDNISIDMIYGLPFMSEVEWGRNIEAAIGLNVEHISAYHLTIEPGTPFFKSGMVAVDDAISEEHFSMLRDAMQVAGFEHYEISNLAKPNRQSRHNSAYWNATPYLGFGPSAHSYNGTDTRRWNVSNIASYLNDKCYFETETLTDADIHNEFIMTALRTASGFSLSHYQSNFDKKFTPVAGVTIDGDKVYIKPENWLISDAIIANLFI